MLTCRRATELQTTQLDTKSHFGQQIVLGIHALVRSSCRRFCREVQELKRVTRECFAEDYDDPTAVLPNEARVRIREHLPSAQDR